MNSTVRVPWWNAKTEEERRSCYVKAIRELRETIRSAPDSVDAYLELADLCESLDRWDEVVAAYREVVRLVPDNAKYHRYLGDYLGEAGRWEEQVAAYRDALRLDPSDDVTRCLLGRVLVEQGRRDEAITAFQEVIQIGFDNHTLDDVGFEGPMWATAYVYLGLLIQEAGLLDQVVAQVRDAGQAPGGES